MAAATDLTFSLYGYTAVVLNDFLTALYLILVKNSPASSGLTTTGLLFYNAALSLPLLGAAVALSGEPAGILAYPDKHSRGFQVGFGPSRKNNVVWHHNMGHHFWLLGAAVVSESAYKHQAQAQYLYWPGVGLLRHAPHKK